jgi:hypothetical protein
MPRKLARPKGARTVIPEVCAFCRWFESLGNTWLCQREGVDYLRRDFGPNGYAPFRRTCDRYEKRGSEF